MEISSNIKVSVIVPCYNVSKYIRRCLYCLKEQTLDSYEVICIDDGSTDDTLQKLNEYKFDNVKIYSFNNQGVSQARNEGIKVAVGEFLYFFDPDDYIVPETLKIIYNKAIETDSDCVQFNFQKVLENTNIKQKSGNGNKHTGIYEKNDILKVYVPRFIGFSASNISKYGTQLFFKNKEMCSVWRFLYKRSIIVDNNIFFSKKIHLGEDTLFNCEYFCYSKRICYIDDVLYTYYSKASGAMLSSLNNMNTLLKNKIGGVEERTRLQYLYKEKHNIDIFPLYAGSLFLSAIELSVKSSFSIKGIKILLKYISQQKVLQAIDIIPIKGNIKIKTLLLMYKLRFFKLSFLLIYIANKVGIKMQ